jgi:hypothetical protein
MSLAPIALFVFNRADKTQKTIEHLLQNPEAAASDIYIFSDGPRAEKDVEPIREVREYLKTVAGFKSVTIIEQEVNKGVSRSIVPGVTSVVNKHGKIIQIDDDMLVVPHFLRFMNDALNYYENDERVACICGLLYPVKKKVPSTFFVRGADCAVWATWKRAWALYEPDGEKLLAELEKRKLTFLFDFHGAFPYVQMLKDQIAGRNDSWAIRWHASAFLQNKLTLYPGESLVKDNGRDDSGTNCIPTNDYDNVIGHKPITVGGIPVKQSRQGFNAFRDFFVGLNKYPYFKRKRKRFKRWMKYFFTGA